MISRRLKGLLQRKNKRKNAHFKKDCFQLKNKRKLGLKDFEKNKAFLTWSDDEESEVEIDASDEITQVCFMGLEGESSEVSLYDFSLLKQENEKLKEKMCI